MPRLPRLFQDSKGIQLSDLSGLSDIHAANEPRQSRGCGEDPFLTSAFLFTSFSHLTRQGREQGLLATRGGDAGFLSTAQRGVQRSQWWNSFHQRQQSVCVETRCLDLVCGRLQASSAACCTRCLRSLSWLGSSRGLWKAPSIFSVPRGLSRESVPLPGLFPSPLLSPYWDMFVGAGLRYTPPCQGFCFLYIHFCLSLCFLMACGLQILGPRQDLLFF